MSVFETECWNLAWINAKTYSFRRFFQNLIMSIRLGFMPSYSVPNELNHTVKKLNVASTFCVNMPIFFFHIRNAKMWSNITTAFHVWPTPFFWFQKRHFLSFRNANSWVSETRFFGVQNLVNSKMPFFFVSKCHFLSFKDAIFFCLWNTKKDWLEVQNS